ncbi:uncharacterized protein MYCFIDRAFT_175126 [Pseudocercospora fijiensis CIRAD86]|uniref:Uncharacterized protein n=1 Tax=Pseudocercospora fijiensis (strain CIRAD86) TaxID=383855 RepID=M2Z1J4_PSEFD|nr:uncharacterized protein MYCFIDRAFT_175126 [Pseudocercospora fijiensis CIRAD86]EME83700.1 hypothetical protein MYCFIDRAFT_175126 [Pseudocercospora fijiensis CIRAD86]
MSRSVFSGFRRFAKTQLASGGSNSPRVALRGLCFYALCFSMVLKLTPALPATMRYESESLVTMRQVYPNQPGMAENY